MSDTTSKFYVFGQFLVDVRRRRLLRKGEAVQLTPKAFEMLLALIEDRDRVLEKDELLKKLWPEQFVEEANLSVNMSALRKALGERASENQYIVTLPRRGYRFIAEVRELTDTDAATLLIEDLGGENAHPSELDAAAGMERAERDRPPYLTPEPPGQVPNNLPIQLTPFIGRQPETAAVKKLLERSDMRLATLTGPGGSGKTRLALHVASSMLSEFPDGVFLVALEGMTDPHLVISSIAQTLGVKEAGGTTLIESLKKFLRDLRVLLILDNFEHLVSASPLLSSLLTATVHFKILVTSRAVLHLSGEHEFRVPPMMLPETGGHLRVPELLRYAAVELFVQRAVAARSDFTLTDRNASAVADICIQLDGLPLAIELAAARVRLLPPRAMLARLETPLKLLTGGARNLPMRQQTMSGAIAWSYDLLDAPCQLLFRRLALFVGGATLEAADAVCNSSGDLGMDVQDAVASLVDNSLLRQAEHAGGEPRFIMLETIREYGFGRLRESGELDSIRSLHAHYFLGLAERAEPELGGEQLDFRLEQLEQEHDNLRAALRWSLENGEEEMGLRLVKSLWWFWYLHGHYIEGGEWLKRVLDESSSEPSLYRARAMIGAGVLAFLQCEYTAAEQLLSDALLMSKQVEDRESIAMALQVLGSVERELGDYEQAVALHRESLELSRELKDKRGLARSLNYIGFASWLNSDLEEATRCYEQSLPLFRELGDKEGVVWSLLNRAAVAHYSGEHERALPLGQESLRLSKEMEYKEGVAWSLNILGNALYGLGRHVRAVAMLQESLHLHHELGDRWRMASILEGLGGLACDLSQPARGLLFFAAAEALREIVGTPLPPVERKERDRHVEGLRASFGEDAFNSGWAAGRETPLEQVIVAALEHADLNNGG
ncbi:MAG TPA: tetratricopeptide repeat protein [Pyrinomonadaceae bacterium]|nr:tetratricopeptide repeat protein [Pyrinomonadaceae bacterium]